MTFTAPAPQTTPALTRHPSLKDTAGEIKRVGKRRLKLKQTGTNVGIMSYGTY